MLRLLWRNLLYRYTEWKEDRPILKVEMSEVNREYR